MNELGQAGFEAQVARVRESALLGRSRALVELFDHLAAASREGRILSEADIAHAVFGRAGDLSGDASVRVYVHRLRKKLAEFYTGPGADEPARLVVPLGDYRLDLEDAAVAPQEAAPSRPPARRPWIAAASASVAIALLLALGFGAWALTRPATLDDELSALVAAPLWSTLSGERELVVVVGDYYIFGELDAQAQIGRMIRDFEINSPMDLDERMMREPHTQGRYVDLDTSYTPVGATVALGRILPVLRALVPHGDRMQVITGSQLTADRLKQANIVYVGYLSGLHLLESTVFANSRYEIGGSYDELTDSRTGRVFVSSAAVARRGEPNTDYGFVSLLNGPGGNRILVIAGTRDIGVLQAAEIATDPNFQAQFAPSAKGELEKMIEVRGIGRANVSARFME